MTTPVEQHPATEVLHVAEVRAALSDSDRDLFDDEFGVAVDAALDADDLTGVQRVLTRWWAHALVEADPQLKADLEKPLDEVEWVHRPFAR